MAAMFTWAADVISRSEAASNPRVAKMRRAASTMRERVEVSSSSRFTMDSGWGRA